MKSLDREEVYSAFAINPNYTIKRMSGKQFSYHIVENFLLHPERAIEVLDNYPCLVGGVHWPMRRQYVTQNDIQPIVAEYCKIVPSTKPWAYHSCTNIVELGDLTPDGAKYPHSDSELVMLLWLSDTEGGTGLYSYNGKVRPQDCTDDELPPEYVDMSKPYTEWENFDGDDNWELLHVAPSKFNTVTIYDATMWHSPHHQIKKNETRYCLASFYGTSL